MYFRILGSNTQIYRVSKFQSTFNCRTSLEAFATEQERARTQAYRFSLCQIAKEKEYQNVQDVVNWRLNMTRVSQAGFAKERKKAPPN